MRIVRYLVFVFVSSFASNLAAEEPDIPSEDLPFEEQVAFFLEESLEIPTEDDGLIAVGSEDCEISDALKAKFDKLLPIGAAEATKAANRHAAFGLPRIANDNGLEVLLHHNEYILNYNTNLRVPVYASYRLDRKDIKKGNRRDCFREDHRLEDGARSTLEDYDEPVYDRGHLVPVGDMHRNFATSVNTFFLSNMMPQSESFNRGVWQFLESSVRLWAVRKGTIHIVTGPVFDKDKDGRRDLEAAATRIEFEKRVAQPTHFFKIILHENSSGFIETMAFLLPHTFKSVGKSEPYIKKKLVSIDEIEEVTGYDFFPNLPNHKEMRIEAFIAPDIWRRK